MTVDREPIRLTTAAGRAFELDLAATHALTRESRLAVWIACLDCKRATETHPARAVAPSACRAQRHAVVALHEPDSGYRAVLSRLAFTRLLDGGGTT